MAGLMIARVTREHLPLQLGERGQTIGQMVDMRIAQALEQGHELQTVSVEFSPEDMDALRDTTSATAKRR